jgi:deoxyribonuclease IV
MPDYARRVASSKTLVGAHVGRQRPLEAAESLGAHCLQLFLSDPQGWRKPEPRDDTKLLRSSPLPVYVHAPYLINVCSPRNNVRYGSRKILQQTCDAAAEIRAAAVVVHPGHAEDGVEAGIGRWVRTLEMLETDVTLYMENTAGGENAVARRFDALGRFWEAISQAPGGIELGFCFDTCHAHAAGEELSDAVERVLAITGRIDLLHANDSRDPPGTGADRHTGLGTGQIGAEALVAMIRSAAERGAPVVVETPGPRRQLVADLEFVREALSS